MNTGFTQLHTMINLIEGNYHMMLVTDKYCSSPCKIAFDRWLWSTHRQGEQNHNRYMCFLADGESAHTAAPAFRFITMFYWSKAAGQEIHHCNHFIAC